MIGLRLTNRLQQKQEASLRLTHTQKIVIKQTVLTRKFDLVGAVHGGEYKPQAECPKCDRRLTSLEIVAGFRDDPTDYTTQCTYCATRFEPKLIYTDTYSQVEIPFYCATQVLAQMQGLETLPPEEIQKQHRAVYHSALAHHGNLRRAFEKIGIQYQFEAITNWQEKVRDYLGKLPDTVVAEVVDMPVKAIRSLRNSLQIRPFSQRQALQE